MPLSDQYELAISVIDAVNSQDPNTVLVDGSVEPLALAQGKVATRWAHRLGVVPSEALLLAARAHHLKRWEVPRSDFPDGRLGYLRWRKERAAAQAESTGELLVSQGYEVDLVERVKQIIRKERLKTDPEVGVYEDVVSLVFIELQLESTAERLGEKAVGVLAKTLRKMTASGVRAVVELDTNRELVDIALQQSGRTDLQELLPLAWNDPVGQARNILADAIRQSDIPAVTVSGQAGGLVLAHLLKGIAPDIPVIFADTGYHFPETLPFLESLAAKWDLNFQVVSAAETVEEHETRNGRLYISDADACCDVRKVLPVERAIAGHDVWLTAVRGQQSAFRSSLETVNQSELRDGSTVVKVNPLISWSWEDIAEYTEFYGIPRHPLYDQGYTSIGCGPCTLPTFGNADDRGGRWSGDKNECGLHIQTRAAG